MRGRVAPPDLAEGEHIGFDAGIEERDLEGALIDGSRLADELIAAPIGGDAVTALIDVDPACGAWVASVDTDAESNRLSMLRRPHYEIEVAGAEAVCERPAGLVQFRRRSADGPFTGEGPAVEPQWDGRGVAPSLLPRRAARRGKSLGPFGAEIRFGRLQGVPVGRSFVPGCLDDDEVVLGTTGNVE